jgi:hypothetical protein
MNLGSTVSNRNEYQEYFLGAKGGQWVGLTILNLLVSIVLKSGNLNLLNAPRPVQACNGIALPFVSPSSSNLLVLLIEEFLLRGTKIFKYNYGLF